MRIGADDIALNGALGGPVPVAPPDLDVGQSRGIRSQGGPPAVVLESGDELFGAVGPRPVMQHLSHGSL